MSGLAKVARILGAEVTGSDRALDGHDARERPARRRPSSTRARSRRTTRSAPPARPSCTAPTCSAELTQLKPTIAVSGTHGKTTTTSMLVHALPGQSYLVGGEVRSTGTNADWTDGEWLIVEADESDRSLLKLHPTIAVVTNAELDHHTTYASSRDVDDTFREFLARARARRRRRPTSLRLRAGRARLRRVRRATLQRAGRAQPPQRRRGARRRSSSPGETSHAAADRLATFEGAGRRFEIVGHAPTARRVVDDYAHHPTEVRATIEAARTQGADRVVALFQPHLFSRTQREAKRVRRRRSRKPTSSCCSTCTPRASARRTTPASPACWSPSHRGRAPRQARRSGRRRTRPPAIFCNATLQERRPAAHDGRRRREHDREGPRRA